MQSGRNVWLRAALWLGLAGAVLLLWLDGATSIPLRAPESAPPATPLVLRGLDGAERSLGDHRSRVVLINLWASWCPPCRVEIPRLSRLHRELGSRGLVVLGLNAESLPAERVASLGQELGIDYEIVLPAGPLFGSFQAEGLLPHTWLIDRQGRVRASHAGLPSERALRRACLRLLDEPAE